MSRKRCYTTEDLSNIIIEDIPFSNASDIDTTESEDEEDISLLPTYYKQRRNIKLETYMLLKTRKIYLQTMKV